MIIWILTDEWDRWLTEQDWKYKEQFERNLNHYKNKLDELNEQWQKEILLALKTKKDNEWTKDELPQFWRKGYRWM